MKRHKNQKGSTRISKSLKGRNFHPAILESIAEGIVVIGLDRKIIFVNKMARDLIGIRNEAPEGKPCSEVIRTDLCDTCPVESYEGNESCASYLMNIHLYRNDTESIPLCLNVAPLHDEKGEVAGFIENFRPMSEAVKAIESLKQTNVVLAQEKDKVDSIIESLADGVFTVDKQLRIKSFNKGMEILTGLKESDVTGLTCKEVLSADNCEGNCPFAHTLRMGYGIANVKERISSQGGDTVPVFMSTAFLKNESGENDLIATVKDLSEIERLRRDMNERYQLSNIIGKSSQMQQIFELIEVLGDADCAILVEGESGTGKELASRAIHHESHRRSKPFIKVNCSAIVEGLFESELFGHVKGAFSGAIKNKAGKFEIAHQGTIFLDEIADMPISLQPKLLRVLQDKEFERVGDNKTRKVDVRIIAATNKRLIEEVEAGRFRKDLYYRLCVVPLVMPALRDRKEDIPLLVNHFLEKCHINNPNRPKVTDVTPSALTAILDYDWPGNIRELENAIEHAYIRTRSDMIDRDSLPESITGSTGIKSHSIEFDDTTVTINMIQRHYIDELMKKYNGNKSLVAKDLGISRTTLWRRLKEAASKH
ncbi:MAG: sigma 54-interacting transcriptional regulator [Nitrospiraceae bacterium]|nr:MAG: sigma 54-interacting transcriptional regulator [Nitrospiraceae bacterium]